MNEIGIKAYHYKAASAEESKVNGTPEEVQAKLELKVSKIVASLSTARKPAVSKAGGFRSFMKTAKTDLKQMNPDGMVLGADAGAAVTDTGFAATVAMPKTGE